jgi:hypothetical protein
MNITAQFGFKVIITKFSPGSHVTYTTQISHTTNSLHCAIKHWMNGALVKISRYMRSLTQPNSLQTSVSRPSHKPFLLTVRKNSGERSLILRLKRTKYNMLLKCMSLRKVILFQTAWHYFIMNNDTNNIVLHPLLQ